MFRNDGGNFSNDPYARLLAMKLGSMSNQDLANQEQIPQQALDQASNLVGSVGETKLANMVPTYIENAYPEAMGLADRIKAAAQKSGINWQEGPNDAGLAKMKALKDLPKNFFEKNRLPEGASSVPEQQARQYQQQLRDQSIQNRNQQQISDADAKKWEDLKSFLFGQSNK